MKAPEVSVIIPCLNEVYTIGACIKKCLEAFRQDAIDGEVVVIDNGSTDATLDVAAKENARVILHTIRGYGSALMRGIIESRGQYIIMADGDGTYDFTDIREFLELLLCILTQQLMYGEATRVRVMAQEGFVDQPG